MMMHHFRASGALFDGSEDHIEHGCQEQTEEGHTQHPEEHRDTHGVAHLGKLAPLSRYRFLADCITDIDDWYTMVF
jgi:hypothetical protein